MNEELLTLLGATPEQIAQAQRRSGYEELSLLGQALSAAGAPAPRGTSTLQRLGQAGQMYTQAPRQTMDTLLQDLLRRQRVQEMQRAQAQRVAQQQAMQTFISGLPEDQRARFQAFPQQAAEAMFREPKAAPGVVGEFTAAREAGLIQPTTTLEQFVAMKKPPAAVATAISGGKPDTFTEEVAKTQAKDFVAIEKSGREAISKARDITRLDNLLSKIETGGAAAFKQAAGNFGINTKDLPEIQAAQAIINKLVPAQRPPGSGTMSDADLALYKESLPRIINQPGANKEIIRSLKEINDYLIEEGKIAAEVTAGRMTREEGIRKIFALGNPVQDFFDRTQQTAPRGPVRPTQEDQSLILKYLQPGR